MALNLDVAPMGHGKGAQTQKGRARRELITKIAARLFAERGYDAVAINDIGFEAGVTGPAIYRYFPSKEALLVSIYADLYSASKENTGRITSTVPDPVDRMVQLIDSHIELAIDHSLAIRIVDREWHNLPEKEAAVLKRASKQDLRSWREALARARPDLDEGSVEVTVHAVFALINSITLRRPNKNLTAAQRQRLREMAISCVFGQTTPPSAPPEARAPHGRRPPASK